LERKIKSIGLFSINSVAGEAHFDGIGIREEDSVETETSSFDWMLVHICFL
tara:strand:- start:78 stop:230 length:153 start_codon:yes stop_codon:yes gene_type:complete